MDVSGDNQVDHLLADIYSTGASYARGTHLTQATCRIQKSTSFAAVDVFPRGDVSDGLPAEDERAEQTHPGEAALSALGPDAINHID